MDTTLVNADEAKSWRVKNKDKYVLPHNYGPFDSCRQKETHSKKETSMFLINEVIILNRHINMYKERLNDYSKMSITCPEYNEISYYIKEMEKSASKLSSLTNKYIKPNVNDDA